jgi:hypothetical protein
MRQEPSITSRPLAATTRRAAHSGSSRWYGIAGLLCLILGIGLAVVVGLISGNTLDRELRACDGTILLPTWGLVMAWASVIAGLGALVLCVVAFVKRRSSRPATGSAGHEVFVGVLCALSICGLLFELLFLHGAYEYTVPIHHLCSG